MEFLQKLHYPYVTLLIFCCAGSVSISLSVRLIDLRISFIAWMMLMMTVGQSEDGHNIIIEYIK